MNELVCVVIGFYFATILFFALWIDAWVKNRLYKKFLIDGKAYADFVEWREKRRLP